MYHWKDESQHVVLDELEWKDEHERLSPAQRDQAVDDLIALVAAVDGILQAQSAADAEYFARIASREYSDKEVADIHSVVLGAYRWQYIISGVRHPHFVRLLTSMTTPAQMVRIQAALAPILCGVAAMTIPQWTLLGFSAWTLGAADGHGRRVPLVQHPVREGADRLVSQRSTRGRGLVSARHAGACELHREPAGVRRDCVT